MYNPLTHPSQTASKSAASTTASSPSTQASSPASKSPAQSTTSPSRSAASPATPAPPTASSPWPCASSAPRASPPSSSSCTRATLRTAATSATTPGWWPWAWPPASPRRPCGPGWRTTRPATGSMPWPRRRGTSWASRPCRASWCRTGTRWAAIRRATSLRACLRRSGWRARFCESLSFFLFLFPFYFFHSGTNVRLISLLFCVYKVLWLWVAFSRF